MPEQDKQAANTPQRHTLGEMLRAARESGGHDLTQLSRDTAVRRDYLEALEESRYGDLPEPVYVRNFVRLYAQAVGLDTRAALDMYAAELAEQREAGEVQPAAAPRRRTADAPAAAATGTPDTRTSEPARQAPAGGQPGHRRSLMTWLPSLLLVVVVVGLAVWAFNSTLFRPGTSLEQPAPDQSAETDAPAAAEPEPSSSADTVRLSVSTEPPGARVLVDAFPLEGLTPVSQAPVTARNPRLIRVELDGYEPQEAIIDLSFDRNISFVLQEAAPPDEPEPAEDVAAASEAAAGTITVTVTDESWLEIYPGTAREGTPHVYTTAQSGAEYTFDLPVYIRAGNAAGVTVSVGGQNLGPLGSAGEITGRAFSAE